MSMHQAVYVCKWCSCGHYKVNLLLFCSCTVVLYCLDPTLTWFWWHLVTCSVAATVWYLYMHCYMCIMQNNLTDLCAHVNNKISHMCKSKAHLLWKCYGLWKCHISWKFQVSSSGNSMICLIETYFHGKLWLFTCKICILCCHANPHM